MAQQNISVQRVKEAVCREEVLGAVVVGLFFALPFVLFAVAFTYEQVWLAYLVAFGWPASLVLLLG